MQDKICTICGYIYHPEENNNVLFEELEETWVCPVCKAKKEKFEDKK